MIIDAHATDTVPSHEVRRRALEALANEGEPMSEVTYDAFRKRVKELEASLNKARRNGLEAAILMLEQEAKAAPTNSLMAEVRNQVADHFIARLRALGEKE